MSRQRNNAGDCPRLVEVALPIREISAESVRDQSLRHGHRSTQQTFGVIQDLISRLNPETLYRQIRPLVKENDWARQSSFIGGVS